MLIGASRCPWECEQKGLMLTYQKMLMLPMPDYSFRCNLWKELIISKGGQITKYSDRFDVSSLSKISEGMYVKEDIQLSIFFKSRKKSCHKKSRIQTHDAALSTMHAHLGVQQDFFDNCHFV